MSLTSSAVPSLLVKTISKSRSMKFSPDALSCMLCFAFLSSSGVLRLSCSTRYISTAFLTKSFAILSSRRSSPANSLYLVITSSYALVNSATFSDCFFNSVWASVSTFRVV